MSDNAKEVEIDADLLVNILISSDGDVALTAERLCTKMDLPFRAIKEYRIIDEIAKLNKDTRDDISAKLRSMLIVKLYALVTDVGKKLVEKIDDLRPGELARAHSSLVNSFATLTAPAAKVTFDFESDAAKLADEFGITPEEIKAEIRSAQRKVETGFGITK